MDLRDVLTTQEAAAIIGCSPSALINWSKLQRTDRPRGVRFGLHWVFNRAEVEEYAKTGPALSTNPGAVRRRRFYERHKR